jgi:hypothetical protein
MEEATRHVVETVVVDTLRFIESRDALRDHQLGGRP